MLKKVVFIVASLFVGLLLIINSIGSSFSQQVVKQAKNAVEEKKYADAERFVAYALDLNNMFYKGDLENGTHVEIFSSISTKTVTETSGEGEDATVNSYNIMQDCIQIALFHLPETFALEDKTVAEGETPIKGGVTFNLSDETSFFVPFVGTNYNYFTYVQYYSFLSGFVYYDDFASQLEGKTVASIEVLDGNGTSFCTITEFAKPVSFATDFHNEYHNLINQYNELSLAYNAETDKTKQEELKNQIQKVYDDIEVISNSGRYIKQHDVDIIYKSSGYIWSIILTVVIFLAIDGLLGFLLFRKRKAPAYVPRKPMTYGQTVNKPTSQPEQFSRKDVFDVEEGNFVIQDKQEESPNEEESEQKE